MMRAGFAIGTWGQLLVISAVAVVDLRLEAVAQGEISSPMAMEFSRYVSMPDGVDLATTVFIAPPREGDRRNPTIAEFTRYGRLTVEAAATREAWRKSGFNFVVVDTRGSGASFGSRMAEVSPVERADIGSVIDWISVQPWSNGRIVVTGLSYDADTAEMATSSARPALVGALIRHSEFDVYKQIVFPGGVAATVGIDMWGQYTHTLDIAAECLADVSRCAENAALAPVDGDTTFALLRHAIASHQQNSRADRDFGAITFSDDYFPSGVVANSIGASAVIKEIETAAVPTQVWASWVDAGTVDSALQRFALFPHSATEVYVAAWTHGGAHPADPYFSDGGPVQMESAKQFDKQLEFLTRVASGGSTKRTIHYVALNSSSWRDTDRWPPSHVSMTTWYLSAVHRLVRQAPKLGTEEHQQVNFAATSGAQNRWRGNFFTGPINYGDRAHADEELLHYDTEQLPKDLEIVGNAVLRLSLRVDRTDAALFAYLEDVAPNGRVTYLTEGELRLMHRRAESPCERTFHRSDALPVIPGQRMQASICLEPIAAHVEAKHRLRITIAGADADTFARYPSSGALGVDVQRGGAEPSSVEIPSRAWQ